MAQTTTGINACDAVIKLDNDSGVLVDISGVSNNVQMNRVNRVSDGTRTLGTDYPFRLVCGKDANITLRIVYSTEEAEAMQLLNDWYENHNTDARTLQIDVPDGNPGSDRYSFEVLLSELPIPIDAEEAGPIMVEVTLLPTGTFSWAQIGS